MNTIPNKEITVAESHIVIALRDAQKASDDNLAQMTSLVETFNSYSVKFIISHASIDECELIAGVLNDRVAELMGVSVRMQELNIALGELVEERKHF